MLQGKCGKFQFWGALHLFWKVLDRKTDKNVTQADALILETNMEKSKEKKLSGEFLFIFCHQFSLFIKERMEMCEGLSKLQMHEFRAADGVFPV